MAQRDTQSAKSCPPWHYNKSDLRWNDHVATVLKKVTPRTEFYSYPCLSPSATSIQKLFESSSLPLFHRVWNIAMQVWCGASAGSLTLLEKVQLKVARAMHPHNMVKRDLRCSLSATFRHLHRGGGFIMSLSLIQTKASDNFYKVSPEGFVRKGYPT